MASYNGEKYIRSQIDSILTCLSETDELIVSDDNSTDRTREIVREYAQKHPQTVRLLNGPGKGLLKNFENALSAARGDIIFFADQDDIWTEDKIRRTLSAFEENPSCAAIVHDAQFVDADDRAVDETFFRLRKSRTGMFKNWVRNSYVGCCMAFRKEVAEQALPFPDKVEMHDWWVGLVVEKFFRAAFIPDRLIRYRRHDSNVTDFKHHSPKKMLLNRWYLWREIRKRKKHS